MNDPHAKLNMDLAASREKPFLENATFEKVMEDMAEGGKDIFKAGMITLVL